MSITANMTELEIIEYLKIKLKIELKPEFKEKELDEEALLLLRICDIKPKDLGVESKYKSKIIKNLDKDFLKLKDNIQQDELYSQIMNEDINNLWNSLDDKLNKLKLGEKLKFINYLIMRDIPPNIDKIKIF